MYSHAVIFGVEVSSCHAFVGVKVKPDNLQRLCMQFFLSRHRPDARCVRRPPSLHLEAQQKYKNTSQFGLVTYRERCEMESTKKL